MNYPVPTMKMPRSFREKLGSDYTQKAGISSTLTKVVRKREPRGSSMFLKDKDNTKNNDVNPYSTTAKSKSSSKMLLSSQGHGSTSLVRPKRIMYPSNADTELAPMNHDAAKLKLENLFNAKGIKRRDPLQLLTKPKRKLNLLKKLPDLQKTNKKSVRTAKDPVIIQQSELKLNRTGMNHMKTNTEGSFRDSTQSRLTTTQTRDTDSRTGTRQGRTRAQIIAEFY